MYILSNTGKMIDMKIIVCILCFTIVFFMNACHTSTIVEDKDIYTETAGMSENSEGSLVMVINGKTVFSKEVIIHKGSTSLATPDYAIVPLTLVLETMGFSVSWINEKEAEVDILGYCYILSMEEETLVSSRTGFDLLTPVPGCKTCFCESTNKELLIDTDTLHSALVWAGIYNNITIYVDAKRIEIKQTGIRPSGPKC